jgi:hypothetical protein
MRLLEGVVEGRFGSVSGCDGVRGEDMFVYIVNNVHESWHYSKTLILAREALVLRGNMQGHAEEHRVLFAVMTGII